MIDPMPTQACSVTDGKNAWTMEKAPMVRNEQILASNNVATQLPPVRTERNNARINDRAAPEKMGCVLNHCARRSNRSIKNLHIAMEIIACLANTKSVVKLFISQFKIIYLSSRNLRRHVQLFDRKTPCRSNHLRCKKLHCLCKAATPA